MKMLISVFLLSFSVLANVTPTKKWNSLLDDFNLNESNHSFCYSVDGKLNGQNIYKKVRLASVSKLVTTYWAVKTLTTDFRYKTKIYYKDNRMFIKGDLDPLISDRKLFFLVSQFKKLGITHIKELVFDSKFKVYTRAEKYRGAVLNMTQVRSAANIKDFLNTITWNKLLNRYDSFINSTPQSIQKNLNLILNVKDLDLQVDKVSFSESSELELEENNVERFLLQSNKLSEYLKFMNVVSNNYMADEIFNRLGGEKGFDEFIQRDMGEFLQKIEDQATSYSKNEKLIKLFTGSGLNAIRNGKRVDNFANCALIVNLIKNLDVEVSKLKNDIWNIAAVPGSDMGTFRRRLKSPRLKNSLIAKTGTLFHTCALAGMIHSEVKSYFGIFHQVRGWKGNVRMMQDKTLTYLWEYLDDHSNSVSKFDYKAKYFFPTDRNLTSF